MGLCCSLLLTSMTLLLRARYEGRHFKLLAAIKERFDRVGLEVPKVEVRFEKLNVEADVLVGSRALPTLFNCARDVIEHFFTRLGIYRPKRHNLSILKDISGSIKPGRTSAYISQTESHIAELTVRETLDFGARCEGEEFAGNLMRELMRLEKENRIRPSPKIDAFMKGRFDIMCSGRDMQD